MNKVALFQLLSFVPLSQVKNLPAIRPADSTHIGQYEGTLYLVKVEQAAGTYVVKMYDYPTADWKALDNVTDEKTIQELSQTFGLIQVDDTLDTLLKQYVNHIESLFVS